MKKILVANRGEIALRIMRTCARMNLKTVAVYSDADRGAAHVEAADEAVALRGASAAETYLSIEKIVRAALDSGADGIHPGYGFLSESALFAEALSISGIVFIGPSSAALRLAGDKDSARKAAAACGIPVPRGYDDAEQTIDRLLSEVDKLGTPLLIKAVAGGGGRGMRLITDKGSAREQLTSASREAASFFGDGRILLEQYIAPARHIEVQLLADSHGNTFHLFERDCSLQRRYQKVIEESPARALDESIRAALCASAVKLAKAVKLCGAATAEFLVPESSHREQFYFLEINPRIQVEHPVTEMVTGIDIVEAQIRIAAGEKLTFSQSDIQLRGHAIEARVCSEIPSQQFRPAAGRIDLLHLPEAEDGKLRLDHALREQTEITTLYDSLLLKTIAHGSDAADATKILQKALSHTAIGGVETNLRFLGNVLASPFYGSTKVPNASFLDANLNSFALPTADELQQLAQSAAGAHLGAQFLGRDNRMPAFRGGSSLPLAVPKLFLMVSAPAFTQEWLFECAALTLKTGELTFTLGDTVIRVIPQGEYFTVSAGGLSQPVFVSSFRGEDRWLAESEVLAGQLRFRVARKKSWTARDSESGDTNHLRAPLPGTIVSVDVSNGDIVEKGERLAVIESMKMEHALRAPRRVRIAEIRIVTGQKVKEQDLLLNFEDPA